MNKLLSAFKYVFFTRADFKLVLLVCNYRDVYSHLKVTNTWRCIRCIIRLARILSKCAHASIRRTRSQHYPGTRPIQVMPDTLHFLCRAWWTILKLSHAFKLTVARWCSQPIKKQKTSTNFKTHLSMDDRHRGTLITVTLFCSIRFCSLVINHK